MTVLQTIACGVVALGTPFRRNIFHVSASESFESDRKRLLSDFNAVRKDISTSIEKVKKQNGSKAHRGRS